MLLKSQDVTYCKLVRQFGTISEIVNGVNYRGSIFVQGNYYPRQQRQFAITEMRRSFLDPEPAIACILVDDGDTVTIWHEDRYILKVVETDRDIVQYVNLAQLVVEMRSPTGVKIEDRWASFRLPSFRCFVGREAVDWISTNLQVSRLDAVILGQRLIDDQWARCLPDGKPFKDADVFYQFTADK